eukprot:COSAG01_NODE_9934_length_2298_cov_34.200250_2_plen_72_part_00
MAQASEAAGSAAQGGEMEEEVTRTARKIGRDIGDGSTVPVGALTEMLADVFEGDPKTLTRVERHLAELVVL